LTYQPCDAPASNYHARPRRRRDARIWPPLLPIVAAAAFTAAGLAARAGCRCQEDTERASGAGTAAALAFTAS